MYHLKLIRALSYAGIVTATKKSPDVFVEDKAIADAAVSTGYFKLIEGDTAHLEGRQFVDWSFDEVNRFAADLGIDTANLNSKEDCVAAIVAAEVNPGTETGEENEKPGKTLEEMTVSELETFAAYKDVSLKGISKKAEIIAKLKEELDTEETENEVDYGSPTMTELQV